MTIATGATHALLKLSDALHRLTVWLHTAAIIARHDALTASIAVHDRRIKAQQTVVKWAQNVLVQMHDEAADATVAVSAEQSKLNAEFRKLTTK